MKYRGFGNTTLEVSEIGFGAWAIGGPAMAGDITIGWGDVDDSTSVKALKKSLDLGINFYDTADFYGLGHSEELLGATWGNRPDVVIASKVGHRLDENDQIYLDYSKHYVLQACEKSLGRLKRESIDFYQLHAAKIDHLQNGECIEAMEQLQKDGKIRCWGISLNTYDPDTEGNFMLDNSFGQGFQLVFNIINQKAMKVMKSAASAGFGIIARMPLQFGLLTGKFDRNSTFSKTDHRNFRLNKDVLMRSLVDLQPVWNIAEKYDIGLDSFALSFVLSHPEVSTVISGIKNPGQAEANTKNIISLKEEDIVVIHDLYSDRFEALLKFMQEKG
jgi:aryl-alcohol dehydrogenase-like predicted oxidoreductase